MSKLNAEQLGKALQQGLRPAYLVTGDDPLLVQEACDLIRKSARAAGFQERELFHADASFQWPQLLHSANSMSLFADQKLLEVRVPSGKPGDAGSKVLQAYCEDPAPGNLLLLIMPRLDRAAQNSKWCKAIDALGCLVQIWPVGEPQLHRWLEQRMQRAGLHADSQSIDILAGKIEGNLLAAVQEIEKLKLLAPGGVVDSALMASAVLDSARYDVFGLVDKALTGNARGAAATLNGLRSEGTDATLALWALSREIRTLLALKEAQQQGQSLELAARQNGVFERRLPLIRSALQRLKPAVLRLLLRECGQTDRTIKGMASGDPWSLLLDITLTLSGTRTLSTPVLTTLLRS